jgi:hypothetical protein
VVKGIVEISIKGSTTLNAQKHETYVLARYNHLGGGVIKVAK